VAIWVTVTTVRFLWFVKLFEHLEESGGNASAVNVSVNLLPVQTQLKIVN
jgi:hypothetical protein